MFKLILMLLGVTLMATTANAALFSLHSTGFSKGEKLDSVYTCDGRDISPQLAWDNAPVKTVSFALILSDPDAPSGTFYHWVVFNLTPAISTLPQQISALPHGAAMAKNSWGKSQYNGPCPPHGSKHRYIFSLYALDTTLTLNNDADAKSILRAIQNHVLGVAELKGVFGR